MKKLIEAFKAFQLIRRHGDLLKLVEDIFTFVKKASEEGKPMICKIALVNTKDGTHMNDFISIWAGIGGEANPIERIRQLRSQKEAVEEMLKSMAEKYQFSEEDKKQVDLTIHYFNM